MAGLKRGMGTPRALRTGRRNALPTAPANDNEHDAAEDEPPERVGPEADDADQDGEGADKKPAEGDAVEDTGPRYKIEVDGEEREVSLNEALRGYQREETFNTRMRQMVEVAKTIDQRGAEAQAARDAYIQLCQHQEQEFAALIPKEPDWESLYKADPAAAHNLEKNYRAVYGTLNAIRQRRAQAQAGGVQRQRPAHRQLRQSRVRQVPRQEQARRPDRASTRPSATCAAPRWRLASPRTKSRPPTTSAC